MTYRRFHLSFINRAEECKYRNGREEEYSEYGKVNSDKGMNSNGRLRAERGITVLMS